MNKLRSTEISRASSNKKDRYCQILLKCNSVNSAKLIVASIWSSEIGICPGICHNPPIVGSGKSFVSGVSDRHGSIRFPLRWEKNFTVVAARQVNVSDTVLFVCSHSRI